MRSGVRFAAGLLALLFLTACGTTLPPRDEPPIAYPPELRSRLVELALREWQAFGGGITDFRGREQLELQAALPENDPRVFHLIQGYWNAVREERSDWPHYVLEQRAAFRVDPGDSWRELPWSAAFISYLMRTAGVDRADFAWSAAHSFYLDHALRSHRRWGDRTLYVPHDLEDHRPLPGDLLCQDRSRPPGRRLAKVAERLREMGRFRAMHCDLVVASHFGRLSLIGGNLKNSVRLIYLPLDPDGHVPRWPPGERERPSPFALLRLNVPYSDELPVPSDFVR